MKKTIIKPIIWSVALYAAVIRTYRKDVGVEEDGSD